MAFLKIVWIPPEQCTLSGGWIAGVGCAGSYSSFMAGPDSVMGVGRLD